MATSDHVLCYNNTWLSGPTYWLPNQDFNCAHWDLCYCPVIDTDPDIAGIGVIVSFCISALLTLLLAIAWRILSVDTSDKPSRIPADHLVQQWLYAPVRDLRWIGSVRAEEWSRCLKDVILVLSDTQLVTGIAILASAIKLTQDGTMLVYHFNIATDLAWLSANTHLLTLLVITRRIKYTSEVKPGSAQESDPEPPEHGALQPIRAALMLVLAGLLLYCSYVTSAVVWYDNLSCPVLCIKDRVQNQKLRLGGEPLQWMIVNYVLVLSSYPQYIIELIPSARSLVLRCVDVAHEFCFVKSSTSWTALRWIQIATYWFVTFWFSDITAVLELIAWFVLGMVWVIQDRDLPRNMTYPNNTPLISPDGWQNLGTYGFGQLVPLFLLLLPALAFVESWPGMFA